MKKHVALTLLALTTLGVLNAHVDLPAIDDRHFVLTQGQLHDPLGWLEDTWTGLSRRCGSVSNLAPGDPRHTAALAAIQNFSPPDSRSARMLQLLSADAWLLAEVEFERLSPAVVLLRHSSSGMHVVETGIWSGSTEPWRAAPRIRRHLHAQAPATDESLLNCYTPHAGLFRPR